MRHFVFMTRDGGTTDSAGNDVENCQQISDVISINGDVLDAYNKMLADKLWYGAFDTCFAFELTSPNHAGHFDLINDEDED